MDELSMLDLTVAIVNWNTKGLLADCLRTVYDGTKGIKFEVCVVDNGSSDGSTDMIKEQFPQVRLIENKENLGFAKSNNLVLKDCDSRYTLLLNSDTLVKGNALKAMVEFMDQHPEAGAGGCKVLNGDGSIQTSIGRFPRLSSIFFGGEFCNRLFRKVFRRPFFAEYGLSEDDHLKRQEVDFVKGCCLILRNETLEKTGLLDENFFMFFEEIELCYRIKHKGFKILYDPEPEIVHLGGKSCRNVKTTVARSLDSQEYFFRKHYGKFNALAMRCIVGFGALLRLPVFATPALLIRDDNSKFKLAWNWHSLKWFLSRNKSSNHCYSENPRTNKKTVLPLYPKRLLNYLLVRTQFALGTEKVRGYPYSLIIDTVNACNLNCPLCPTGLGMEGRKKGYMGMDLFRKIIDQLGDYAFSVVLYNWGEPLLNKDIYSMIEYSKSRRMKTILSSNLNLFDEQHAERLVQSGLDQLIVSLDGVTQKTYGKYRRGGDLEKALKNLQILATKKRDLGSTTPLIIWQFLVFQHNQHEVDQVEPMAKRLGADGLEIFQGYLGGPGQTPFVGHTNTEDLISKWLVNDPKHKGRFDYFSDSEYLSEDRCFFLWKSATINWDGGVSPCCCVYDSSTDFGNIAREDFKTIWNNDKFRSARSAVTGRSNGPTPTICNQCKVFKKS